MINSSYMVVSHSVFGLYGESGEEPSVQQGPRTVCNQRLSVLAPVWGVQSHHIRTPGQGDRRGDCQDRILTG